MKIGDYTLHEIHAGRLGLDGGAMFGIVPKPLWERRIPADGRNRIPLAMRCLLLEGDGRLVLIDNGVGDKYDAKFGDIYAVDRESSELHGSLAAAGFGADEVTDVILTHLHFDHCGGSTVRDASGSLRVAFPNATFHVQRDHWDWAHRSPREGASFLPENLDPLEASGQLRLADGPGPVVPGIDALVVNGHTRGQQLLKLSDAEQTLVFVADLIPTAAHLPPLWVMAYDIAPLDTLAEKTSLLEQAAQEEWLLFFEHDTEIATARVQKGARGFEAIGASGALAG
ncbi:MAG: MBL fold metallo-hydrolase [Bacteroidota bacterium]